MSHHGVGSVLVQERVPEVDFPTSFYFQKLKCLKKKAKEFKEETRT